MAIALFIIYILLLIFLCRVWTAVFLQLRTANAIKNNVARATQSYCILGLIDELKEFQDKLCKLIDNLLDISKTIKVVISFKKINLQCFLTNEEIEFLENNIL
jgi:hypothetical protein